MGVDENDALPNWNRHLKSYKVEMKRKKIMKKKECKKVTSSISVTETASTFPTTVSISYQKQTFCSLCGLIIHDYIPEYFLGEAYNPACRACKSEDSLWDPDNPFSAFPAPTQPVSLVTHWIIPPRHQTAQGSIPISMVSHCLKDLEPNVDPDNTDEKMIMKEEFEELIAEFREQLKADRAKILEEVRKDFSWIKEN